MTNTNRTILIDLLDDLPHIESKYFKKYLKRIKIYLQDDDNLTSRDFRGWSPLHFLAYHNVGKSGMLTNLLITSGYNINVEDYDGNTPLHYTIFNNNLKVLKILLDAGADPIIKNNDGYTPAIFALKFGSRQKIYNILKDRLKF